MHSSTVILGVLLLRVGNDKESTELGIDLEDTQVCSRKLTVKFEVNTRKLGVLTLRPDIVQ